MVYSNDTDQYELAGIISFRNVCTTEGLFTRTSPFVNWVLTTLINPPIIITIGPPTVPTPKPDVLGEFEDLKW